MQPLQYSKDQQTIAHGPNSACHLLLEIKFSWNIATLIFVLSVDAFALQQQSGVVVTNYMAFKKPKNYLPCGP